MVEQRERSTALTLQSDCSQTKTIQLLQNVRFIVRNFLLAVVAVAAMMDVMTASAAWTIAPPGSEKSKEIAQMNIMDRPNRVLHFYGDAVRLANRRRDK